MDHLLGNLRRQLNEAAADGVAVRKICASQPTIVDAFSPGTPSIKTIEVVFGYELAVLNDLPYGVWVLALDEGFDAKAEIKTYLEMHAAGYLTQNQLHDLVAGVRHLDDILSAVPSGGRDL